MFSKKIGFLVLAGIIVAMVAARGNSGLPSDAQTEEYLKSQDGLKLAAQIILGKQFPGWCNWSSAFMVMHLNGDVFVRCNGDFAVDTTHRIAMRIK